MKFLSGSESVSSGPVFVLLICVDTFDLLADGGKKLLKSNYPIISFLNFAFRLQTVLMLQKEGLGSTFELCHILF